MKCPVCKTKPCTTMELDDNLNAAACEACGGHWISKGNYTRWLKGHGETLPEKPFSEVQFEVDDVQDAKICPECGRLLLKYKVGHGLDFFLAQCPACGGVWLDHNEWNALQDKNLHDEIHKIFSTRWQNQIRSDQKRETLDKAYANQLGSEAYARAQEMRTWLQDQPQKAAILAFLADDDPYRV